MTEINVLDPVGANDLRWVKPSQDPDGSWHLIEKTYYTDAGIPMVLTRDHVYDVPWDGTYLDRLPGGSEKSCENCLVLLAGDVDEPADDEAAPAPKRRGRPPKNG